MRRSRVPSPAPWVPAWFLSAALLGCSGPQAAATDAVEPSPSSPLPRANPTEAPRPLDSGAAATVQPTLTGDWSVTVTSDVPGIDPDLVATPEQRAKMLFAHHAEAKNGKLTVEHRILSQRVEVDGRAASDLDAHMQGVDWDAVADAAAKESGSEGGTRFTFAIVVGAASWEIVTSHIELHPDLMKIVDAVKAATGKP